MRCYAASRWPLPASNRCDRSMSGCRWIVLPGAKLCCSRNTTARSVPWWRHATNVSAPVGSMTTTCDGMPVEAERQMLRPRADDHRLTIVTARISRDGELGTVTENDP